MIVSILRCMLYPFFKWVYKNDFRRCEERVNMFSRSCGLKNGEIEELKSDLRNYQSGERTINSLLTKYEYNLLTKTPKGEMVVISYSKLTMLSADIVLSHLRTVKGAECCKMGLSMRENSHVVALLAKTDFILRDNILMTTITDVGCLERNNGYATTLLSFAIQQAREQNIKYVGGWLSYVDREHHEDLKRLYERLGFKVYLFPEHQQGVIILDLDRENL